MKLKDYLTDEYLHKSGLKFNAEEVQFMMASVNFMGDGLNDHPWADIKNIKAFDSEYIISCINRAISKKSFNDSGMTFAKKIINKLEDI